MKRIMVIILLIAIAKVPCAFSGEIELLQDKFHDKPFELSKWMCKYLRYIKEDKRKDYHQIPEETLTRGGGDCEDLAIFAQSVLGKGELHGLTDFGYGHVVLKFEHKGKEYYMSNGKISKAHKLPFGMWDRSFRPKSTSERQRKWYAEDDKEEQSGALKKEMKKIKDDAGYKDVPTRKYKKKYYKPHNGLPRSHYEQYEIGTPERKKASQEYKESWAVKITYEPCE